MTYEEELGQLLFLKAKDIPFDVAEALETGFSTTGTTGAGKTQLLKHLTERILKEGVTVYVLDVSQAWNHNSPIVDVVHVTEDIGSHIKRVPTVFDLSKLGYRQKQWWANRFVETVYKEHVEGYTQPEFIILEECQTYIPSGALRSPTLYEPMINLITVARNYKLRYGLATQFPALCDANLFKAPQQRYFGWTTEYNDVERIRSYFPREERELLTRRLRELGKMRFMYQFQNSIEEFSIKPYGVKA